MPCYNPLKGYRSRECNPKTGKTPIVFKVQQGDQNLPVDLPCGRCIGCRLERARQWAIRCVHEASLHERNSFITLTYAPENLPPNGSLKKKDFQDFMKRLRFRNSETRIRFFHCGEYGENYLRPHYHALLFGFDFSDKRPMRSGKGFPLFRSEELEDLWPHGFSTIGAVTFESASYVARYVMKKHLGADSEAYYEWLGLEPEYVTMSRRPGIASAWFDKFQEDVFPHDRVVLRGREMRPPKYYDKLFDLLDHQSFYNVQLTRKFNALARVEPTERIAVREEHAMLMHKQNGVREYESNATQNLLAVRHEG